MDTNNLEKPNSVLAVEYRDFLQEILTKIQSARYEMLLSVMTNEEWNTYFNGHWYFSDAKQDKQAMFSEMIHLQKFLNSIKWQKTIN
ncbi:MAG: hypothetical protein LBU51_01470 [Bacteroidales bacterium]|jgi:hypothetical protein|nr:hypothetical protein [Bacteroidales bacterium]